MESQSFKRAPSKNRFLIRKADGSLRWCMYRSEEEACEIKERWKCRQQRRRLKNAVGDGCVCSALERKI